VGLNKRWLSSFLLFSSVTVVHAAPMLRLVNSTVGPIPVASGTNGPAQTVEAYNAGDGSLSLSVSVPSSVNWLTAALGPQRACQSIGSVANCLPINFTLNTSGLATGKTYTAIVTVNDANPATVDAPQTITVTVQVGGIDTFVAPGTSQDFSITTNHAWNSTRATTQDGNNWLSLVLDGTGSFRFVFPYRIHLQPTANMAAGTYNGSVTTAGSSVAGENLTIPVTMRVTTQPIAQPTPAAINLRLAQGAPPLIYPFDPFVALKNVGQGTLTPGTMTTTGGSWIKPDPAVPGYVAIDPSGLSIGESTGSVTIPSNAVNSPTTIPVTVQVVAKGAPSVCYQCVLDNITSIPGDAVSPGDVTIVKGDQLSFSPFTQAQTSPLPPTLGGTSVLINGVAAPLYYTSYGQIAFQVPYNTPAGQAIVQVKRDDGQIGNPVSVDVVMHAPRLLPAVFNPDSSLNTPDGAHPAKRGDTIVLYGFGFGPTNPSVVAGTPAPLDPLAAITDQFLVNFGGNITAPQIAPAFVGLTPNFAGVYQVNVVIPDDSPTGIVDVSVGFNEARSNSLKIGIQ
jgi:uncharacterized protein (TIGR03437 family)